MKSILIFVYAFSLLGQDIATFCGDNSHTCAGTTETVLTPSNVTSVVKLGAFAVTGNVYSQPLIAQRITTGSGVKDLIIIATMHGTIYAFDANRPNSAAIWSNHLSDPRTSYTSPMGRNIYSQEMGCMSTPVHDGTYVYVVCAGPGNLSGDATWKLYKVALSDGTVAASVTASGTVSGTGTGGSTVSFVAERQMQRPSLVLANSKIYVAYGSYADDDPWFGWVMSYDTATLTQQNIWNPSPNAKNGGFWGAGGFAVVDGSGNLYVMVGNAVSGTYNPTTDMTESVVKLSGSLAVLDYFTPSDHATRDANDYDLGSSYPVLIGSLIVASGKRNSVYTLLQNDLGHLQGGAGTAPQVSTKAASFTDCVKCGSFGGAAVFNGSVYLGNKGSATLTQNKFYRFAVSGGVISSTPDATSANGYPFTVPLWISANGTANAILWGITPDSDLAAASGTGHLAAFDPSTLAVTWSGPSIGTDAKFQHCIVWHGRVYVPTFDGAVLVFGLQKSVIDGQVKLQGGASVR